MSQIRHPLMTKERNSEENDNTNSFKNANNENESTNLLDNNDMREHNNKDIRNKIHKIIFYKKSLIYLSYAIQILIYFILLQKYFDKINYIKIKYNKLFDYALISIIFILLKHLQNIDDSKEMNFFLGLILSIISSISMYFFLYKLVIVLTFKVINDLMLMTFVMFLYLSIINYIYSKRDINRENRNDNKIILYSSWIVILFFYFIFYYFEIIKKQKVKFDLLIMLFMNIISINHIEILFQGFDIKLKNYPVIRLCLFIDIFLVSLIYYLIYFAEYKELKLK